MKSLILVLACLFTTLSLPGEVCAQQREAELPEEAKKRLNHIIGHWSFKTQYFNRHGEVKRTVTGTEEAHYIIDGRVVQLTTNVSGVTSKAWLFYDTTQSKFCLTSVDPRGDLWVLTGDLDTYTLTSTPKRQAFGRDMIIRFTHTNIQEDSFDATMASSIDDGKTWWTRSKQHLTRTQQKPPTQP